jgi:hypothetical protein
VTARRPSSDSANAGSAPARVHAALTLEFDGECVVYDARTGNVHRLDPIGSIVWQLLDGRTTVDVLVPDLAAAFSADPGVIRKDVDGLLRGLSEAGLLADGSPPAPPPDPLVLTNPPKP